MNPAERAVALPTGRLLAAAWLGAVLAGAGWLVVALAGGWSETQRWTGPAVAGVTAVAATLQIMLLRPWVPKQLIKWPMIWIAGSFVRLAMTLAGTFLLYSATPYRGVSLWLAMAAAYVVILIGETRVYASAMKHLAPPA